MTTKKEVRTFHLENLNIEKREAGSPKIIGYAAVFGVETEIGNLFAERIAKGAFRRAIREKQDVRALFNHDSDYVLGRSKAGTLSMTEDDRGLKVEIDPPDTQLARDTLVLIERGDLDGMSFAFTVKKQEVLNREGALPLRTILDVDLYDVSVVTFPAYEQTDVNVRSAEEILAEIKLDNVTPEESAPEVKEPDQNTELDLDYLTKKLDLLELDK